MKQALPEAPCVRDFRERLGELDFELEVQPTPRKVSIAAVNTYDPPRFRLEFSPGSTIDLRDIDRPGRMALVGLLEPSGESELFLIGQDEALFSQPVTRLLVPHGGDQRPQTVSQALEALTPDPVKEAIKLGHKVLRQGDIWFVPVAFGGEASISGTRHVAESFLETRFAPMAQGWVRHPEHKAIFLDRPHWAYNNLIVD